LYQKKIKKGINVITRIETGGGRTIFGEDAATIP
jgi:hypothetical protein